MGTFRRSFAIQNVKELTSLIDLFAIDFVRGFQDESGNDSQRIDSLAIKIGNDTTNTSVACCYL